MMNPALASVYKRLHDSFPGAGEEATRDRDRASVPAAPKERKPVVRLLDVFRSGILGLTGFTFVVNTLLLIQPVYMLQVYDRVLASGSIETLIFISMMAGAALLLLGMVDSIRSMMASRLAARMGIESGADAFAASLNGVHASNGDIQPLRDLATIRSFVSNRTILGYLDLPFAPLFIGLLFFIHPHLFWLTVIGAALLILIAVLNQQVASRVSGENAGLTAMMSAQAFAKGAETIKAMGMARNVTNAWGRDEITELKSQDDVAMVNAVFAAISRIVRLGLQLAILGYGGYLVLAGEMTGGMIFASSLISGRGLQPIDQIIGSWKGLIEARKAWERLNSAFLRLPDQASQTALPTPRGRVVVDQLTFYPTYGSAGSSAAPEPILRRISLEIEPGECVAVIGPSGAGKSTLARAFVGIIQPHSGAIRIDGASIIQWDRETLGRHIGYLSQDIDLFPGTIAQNIARFEKEARDEDIVAASRKAQVHELILGLQRGYDTLIGPGGQQLSGGQRQRIGLARAFYGDPKLLILDEPNASLDGDGDQALERAFAIARQNGVTVVAVTQRRQIAEWADKILLLKHGMVADFGPRQEVFDRQNQKMSASPATGSVPVATHTPQPGTESKTLGGIR